MSDIWHSGLISKPFSLGNGVSFRVLKQRGGRLELAVVINDDMTAEQLRGVWPKIDKARLDIRKLQGSDMQKAPNALIWSYDDMHSMGYSYGLIAMDINYDCLVHLCYATEEIPDLNASEIVSEGISRAFRLMRIMRMKDKTILDWITQALEDIKEGHAPWALDNGPISDIRVRDTLRQWNKERQSEVTVVKNLPKREMVSVQPIVEANKQWSEQAKRLLRHTYPDSLTKYERMTLKIMRKASQASSDVSRSDESGTNKGG